MPRTSAVSQLINDQNPGTLDRLVDLYAPLIARSAAGGPGAAQWVQMAAGIWAGTVEMPERSGTITAVDQERPLTSIRVKLRYRADIQSTWLIREASGRWLEIESLNTMGMRNEWLILLCRSWKQPQSPTIYRATSDGDQRITSTGVRRVLAGETQPASGAPVVALGTVSGTELSLIPHWVSSGDFTLTFTFDPATDLSSTGGEFNITLPEGSVAPPGAAQRIMLEIMILAGTAPGACSLLFLTEDGQAYPEGFSALVLSASGGPVEAARHAYTFERATDGSYTQI